MALQLYIGHSGRTLPVDTSHTSTLDALRTLISEHASIPSQRQILLTPRGRSVRQQNLLTETELFVFDSSLLSASSTSHSLLIPSPASQHDPTSTSFADTPPDTLADQTSLGAWQGLFGARLAWAVQRRETCLAVADEAQRRVAERAVIQRGLDVALESLKLHMRMAEGKVGALEEWVAEVARDHERRTGAWEADLAVLNGVQARGEFARFVRSAVEGKGRVVLSEFLGTKAGAGLKEASAVVDEMGRRAGGARDALVEAQGQTQKLLDTADQVLAGDTSSMDESMEPGRLMEEIDVLLKKITSDDRHVGALPRTPQSVSQASKIALLHTRNFLPNLSEYAEEMHGLLVKTTRQRNSTAESCLQLMQELSRIESILARVYAEVKATTLNDEQQVVLNSLNIAARLPYVYGSLLIEALRRTKWISKMKKDSSTLAEEMAVFQEEESGRRKKWLNSVDDVIHPEALETKAQGIEINLQSETDAWPEVSREEIQSYISSLSQSGVPTEVTSELTQAFKALDHPTRKQVKHAKVFRDGSLLDAAFASTSLLVRGEDDLKVLRDANSRLTDELRGQKSRVRKLEDLLHRQTSASRTTIGDVFTPNMDVFSSRPTSPSPTLGIRRISEEIRSGSSRSRRTSSHQEFEEKRLARRVVQLEMDLYNAREAANVMRREARDRADGYEADRVKVEEAEAIKRDIMRNMEAQQREFVEERKGLERDLTGARSRVEELEDELDRILGSRDQGEARARLGEEERARIEGDLAAARKDVARQKEQTQSLEDRLQGLSKSKNAADAEIRALRAELERKSVAEADAMAAAAAIHTALAPEKRPPTRYADILLELEGLARRSTDHVKELGQEVALAKAENASLGEQHKAQALDLDAVRVEKNELDSEIRKARERHAVEVSQCNSLSTQLEDEREQLRLLRGKFADGETGADALRQRLEDQETQVGELSKQLAEITSYAKSLDEQHTRTQSELKSALTTAEDAHDRLDDRGKRAKDITQRLYAQNTRLLRLLEALGFAVTHKDGQMIVERASKVAGSSTTLGDASQSIVKSTAAPSTPPRKVSEATPDASTLTFLHWTESPTSEAEAEAFQTLVSNLSLFSVDAFSDALSKRLRDFEYTARKFRLESRSSSVRASKATQDAATKLAVRDFKEGDLALFLPTKGKNVGAWAAFNINAPHHFLREREGMNLSKREWLVARITRIEERTVDLSASGSTTKADDGHNAPYTLPDVDADSLSASVRARRDPAVDTSNPFDLSPGLTWYLVHAQEDRGHGAPATPGAGKVTVQGNMESARAIVSRAASTSISAHAATTTTTARAVPGSTAAREDESDSVKGLKATLGRSLDSRRSSAGSARRSGNAINHSAAANPSPLPGREDGGGKSPDAVVAGPAKNNPASSSSYGAGLSLLSAALGRAGSGTGAMAPTGTTNGAGAVAGPGPRAVDVDKNSRNSATTRKSVIADGTAREQAEGPTRAQAREKEGTGPQPQAQGQGQWKRLWSVDWES